VFSLKKYFSNWGYIYIDLTTAITSWNK
jgi:hypothetical protein